MSCIKFYIRYLSIGAGVVHKVSSQKQSQDCGPPILGCFELCEYMTVEQT